MPDSIALVTLHRTDDMRIYRKEARSLSKNAWKVTILGCGHDGTDRDGICFRSVPQAAGRAEQLLLSRGRILSAIERLDARLLILHDAALLPLLPILHNMGYRTIYDAHEDLPCAAASDRRIPAAVRPAASLCARHLLQRYLPTADGVIASTVPIAERLASLGFPSTLVRDRLTCDDVASIEHALLHETPVPDAVCCCGTISERCGASVMIRACRRAGVTLLLAGRFESDELRARLERMPEYDCVRYEGVPDRCTAAALYARAQAGLLLFPDTPAARESEPAVLFEYLAAGLPVVASSFPYWKSLAHTGQIRFTDSSDEAAAAAAIRAVLSDEGMRMQTRFHRRAMQERFSFAEEEARLLTLCESLRERTP
jgi:hypothetical protein